MPPKTTPFTPPPLYLENLEISSPIIVLHSFFSVHGLLTTRELLWKWFRHTATGSFPTAITVEEKKELADFYEHVQKLIEAAHIISVYSMRQHLNGMQTKK